MGVDATRVVFDANIYMQALFSPSGPSGRCLQLAFDGRVHLFISPFVLDELREVTSRPKIRHKHHLAQDRIDDFVEAIEIAATVLDDFLEPFAYKRDPDDAHYVNLALAAGARLIVSRDTDLLELMEAAKKDAIDFQTRFPTLRIMDPVSFLRDFDLK
jgi:putative PIN family toxin of toxin-antitoxin system